MTRNHQQERIQSTLGDLIVAVSDAAFELYGNDRETYLLASVALEEILKKAPIQRTDRAKISGDGFADRPVFH